MQAPAHGVIGQEQQEGDQREREQAHCKGEAMQGVSDVPVEQERDGVEDEPMENRGEHGALQQQNFCGNNWPSEPEHISKCWEDQI